MLLQSLEIKLQSLSREGRGYPLCRGKIVRRCRVNKFETQLLGYYLLWSSATDIEVVKRQLDDFVGLTDERVKEAIDIRRIWLWIIRRCERATLGSVRAAVDDARATCNKSQYHVNVITSDRAILYFELWTLDFRLWILYFELWILDFRFYILDFGLWTLNFGL